MRRVLLTVLAVIIGLSLALPTMAASPTRDNVKLRVFVHYPKGKPVPQPATCDPTESDPATYGLTGWRLPGDTTYHVNYSTIPASVTDAQSAITKSFDAWESSSGIRFTEGLATKATRYKYDGENVVIWGRVPGGAIAVTYTWYNQATGQVVEVDTIMGTSLPWAYTSASNPDATCGDLYSYDVQDILTHEIGHWVGLDDLYDSVDHDLTMYGYGAKGELKKDTLAKGDTLGAAATR